MNKKLSSTTIQIIDETAQLVVGNATKITKRMYEILFLKYPDVKKLFINKPEDNFMILAEALAIFVVNINKLDKLMPALENISILHIEVNVSPGHYPMVGMALLEAMEDVLGKEATVEFMDAWREAYQFLANILIDREKEMYKEIES